jgi:hypothetical protein
MPFISMKFLLYDLLSINSLVHQHCVLRLDEYLDLNFELDGLVDSDLYLKFIHDPI